MARNRLFTISLSLTPNILDGNVFNTTLGVQRDSNGVVHRPILMNCVPTILPILGIVFTDRFLAAMNLLAGV